MKYIQEHKITIPRNSESFKLVLDTVVNHEYQNDELILDLKRYPNDKDNSSS